MRWTTHSPQGLSQLDVDMATICDALAKDFDEVEAEPTSCEAGSLTDKAKSAAGDCCTPKKK